MEPQPFFVAGCSPDPDDVFMFYALTHGLVDAPFRVTARYEDIQTLNRKAIDGMYEITAISAAMYPFISHRYALLSAGSSVGRGYGPVIVGNRAYDQDDLKHLRIAIPGRFTTAYLLCRTYLPDFAAVEMDFEEVVGALKRREVEGALLIHEAQMTYREQGLVKIVSLHDVWERETGLPLPLGLEAVRRDVASDWGSKINQALVTSIESGNRHIEDALRFAITMRQTGLDAAGGQRYLDMYVNDDTRGMRPDVRRALTVLYERAHDKGLLPHVPELEIYE